MYVYPVESVSERNRMKKEYRGPRAETLMLIRQFARMYEYKPLHGQRVRKFLVN